MTRVDTISRTPQRLRPASERAIRQLRFVWLLGWTVPAIAAWLGVGPATVYRRVKAFGLRAQTGSDEVDRLVAEEVRDQPAAALLASNDPLAKELVAILAKLNAARPKPAAAEMPKDKNGTHTGEWCDDFADEIERLFSLQLGPHPPALVTTTPRAPALIRRLKADRMVAETRRRMADNAANPAPGFVDVMQAAYGDT